MILLKLTKEQAEKLSSVLWGTTDCGPGEGWSSSELNELIFLVDEALEDYATQNSKEEKQVK